MEKPLYSHKRFASFIIPLLLIGCITNHPPQPPQTRPPQLTSTSTGVPSLTEQPTRTLESQMTEPARVSPTPTEIAAELQKTEIVYAPTCAGNETPITLPDDYGFEGMIVYNDFDREQFISIGGTPLVSATLPITWTENTKLIGFSPNGDWLAYETSEGAIGLLSPEGKLKESNVNLQELSDFIPVSGNIGGWMGSEWISNDSILAGVQYRESPEAMRVSMLTAILDPFTVSWQYSFLDQLPDRLRGGFQEGGVSFSPDMSRVLYFTANYNLVLWDVDKKTKIWKDENRQALALEESGPEIVYYAQWSPDSSTIAYVATERTGREESQLGIALLDREGVENRLITNFSAQYDNFYTGNLRWSADGRFLAFSVTVERGGDYPQTLYVYDTKTRGYVHQCPLHEAVNIFWSPDGRQVAYSDDTASPLVVIDLETGQVFKLADRTILAGWSSKFVVALDGK